MLWMTFWPLTRYSHCDFQPIRLSNIFMTNLFPELVVIYGLCFSNIPGSFSILLDSEVDLHRITSSFHGEFAMVVACQQWTLTFPDTWFLSPFRDLIMLQAVFLDFPCLFSTFHLANPSVLSRLCSQPLPVVYLAKKYKNTQSWLGYRPIELKS